MKQNAKHVLVPVSQIWDFTAFLCFLLTIYSLNNLLINRKKTHDIINNDKNNSFEPLTVFGLFKWSKSLNQKITLMNRMISLSPKYTAELQIRGDELCCAVGPSRSSDED